MTVSNRGWKRHCMRPLPKRIKMYVSAVLLHSSSLAVDSISENDSATPRTHTPLELCSVQIADAPANVAEPRRLVPTAELLVNIADLRIPLICCPHSGVPIQSVNRPIDYGQRNS
jgi:hypothetical protein